MVVGAMLSIAVAEVVGLEMITGIRAEPITTATERFTITELPLTDSVNPAICMNEDCDYVCEMEPDQDRGWCDECSTNTIKSALVLAGII